MSQIICKKCGLPKNENYFNKNSINCKDCTRFYRKERYKKPDVKIKEREQFLRNYFKRAYGITIDFYQEMLLKQNGVCAICLEKETFIDPRSKKPKQLSVDHCHKTGKIRGLLCYRCNQGIGVFKENTELFGLAINYINYWNGSFVGVKDENI